jgi:glycosyltransferase involved in cell wall biosynthesis
VRILHWAIPYYQGFGGQSIFIERLALGFVERGHEVAILTNDNTKEGTPNDNSKNLLDIFRLNLNPTNLDAQAALKFASFAALIQKFNPEVIHIHNLASREIVYLKFFLNRKDANIPTICTIHDLETLKRVSALQATGELLKQINRIVSPSEFIDGFFEGVNTELRENFKIIYNGVPENLSQAPAGKNQLHLLFAAELNEHKGAVVLLNSWSKICKKHPNITLYIAGDGTAKEFLEQYAITSGIGSQVVFTGWLSQNELNEYLTSECIFIMPSMLGEAFGLIAAEASMAGAAVIVSRIGALPEIVEDRVSGLVVTPGDTTSLSQAIEELLNDEELRKKFGIAAKKRAQTLFSMKNSVDEYEKTYHQLITAQKSSN